MLGCGGAPALPATAAESRAPPAANFGRARPRPRRSTTATSSLALLHPAVTYTVTTLDDVVDPSDGQLSLREAVAKANATAALDAIAFKSSLEGQTLVLAGGEFVVSQDLTMDGDLDDDGIGVTLSGGDVSRLLWIRGGGVDVSLRDLTLTAGRAPADYGGGAIRLGGGRLTVTGCCSATM